MKKKKILLTLAVASMMGLAGCGETSTDPQTPVDPPVVTVDPVVTGITLKAEGDKTTMDIGTTLKFTATVTGEGDFNKQYTFSVDKEDIATISNEGVLTAKAEGSVVVTATAAGDTTKKSSITITVNEVAVIEIKDVVKDKRQHVVGEITALTTRSFVIDDGTGAVLVFTKTAPEGYAIGDVVSVAGKVTDYHNNLQFPETSVIKKTENTIETKTIATPTAITGASFDEMAETITTLKPVSFWGTIYKEGDYLAVKVEDGSTHIIEPTDTPDSVGLTVGIAYNITGYLSPYYEKYSYNGLFITSATVKPIPVTSITVGAAGGATSMGLNETLQMSVTIAPEKATNKAVTWSVDKEDVATIDENGLLTSAAPGTVVVTATAKDGSGVTGTKSIEVLEFKDPVVSLTLGTAPTETVLGDGDIDVTVTVAGESSTSNFNPAYTPTSSDETVATVQATDTGIKIHPVAAGTVTITVKTTGTNADGEQLTKTISLEVLGEPKVKKMTVSEAMAWRPTDVSKTYTDKSQLVEITGVCDYTNVGNNYFYISDKSGGSIEGSKLFSDGTFAYDNTTHEYSFTKGGEATAIKTDLNMKGKEITIKGTLCYYKNATSGVVTMEVTNGTFSVGAEPIAPTIIDATHDTTGGTYEMTTEGVAFDDTITIDHITPAAGYKLGSLVVDQAYTVYNTKNFTDNGDGSYKVTFKACNYNEVKVNFVPNEGLETKTVAEAIAIAGDLELLNNRNPITGYTKVSGVLDSISDLSKNNFVLRDSADSEKKITVFGSAPLKALLDAGELGIGYLVTVDVQIQNYGGTLELVNTTSAAADKGTIDGYTVTAGSSQNGSITSMTVAGNPITSGTKVDPGTVVTVTIHANTGYLPNGVSATGTSYVKKNSDTEYEVTVYDDSIITAGFIKDVEPEVLTLNFADGNHLGVADSTAYTASGNMNFTSLALGFAAMKHVKDETQHWMQASNGALWNTAAVSGNISRIVVSALGASKTKLAAAFGTSVISGHQATADYGTSQAVNSTGGDFTFTPTSSATYFNLGEVGGGNARITAIKIYYVPTTA